MIGLEDRRNTAQDILTAHSNGARLHKACEIVGIDVRTLQRWKAGDGLVAGDGGTVIWPLLIGVSKAKEYLMRGTLLKGREAERIGLVNHCLPGGEVLAEARKIALELAHGPTWAIRWTKLSINQILKDRANRLLEASMALEQVTFATADHREATMAFKERRKPVFTG